MVNVGYRSTNYWVVGSGDQRLIVDLGWPGGMGALTAQLQRRGVALGDIQYALATHYHIDHAGCAQELKQAGVKLLVMESQRAAIAMMKQWTKPEDHYLDISLADNLDLPLAESRELLASIGLAGEIVATPGHSDDSVSLLLDSGPVFTGDLTPKMMLADDDAGRVAAASWRRLHEMGARMVYPGHGRTYPLVAAPEVP
ncbi:MAG TPA: MBL fold metallo-hydrolase [Terriglobales bacterium]|nr:MBL fold metallo-hydrolase [Terriglobales bacterium]